MRHILASLLLLVCCVTANAQQITRIPQLPSVSALNGVDLFVVDQADATSATGFTTRKATINQFLGTANTWSVLQTFNASIAVNPAAVAGSPPTFWYPTYFGNTGSSLQTVIRANRLFLGTAIAASSDIAGASSQPTTKSWLDIDMNFGVTSVSQIAVLSTTGQLAGTFGARTSDFRAWLGSASPGSQGVTGFGINDDGGSGHPIVCGVCGIVYQLAGNNTGVSLNQFDANAGNTTVPLEPFGSTFGGQVYAGAFTAGAFAVGTTNPTAAFYVGPGATQKFNKGIVYLSNALDTAVGAGGGGVAIELFRGQSLRWRNTVPATDAEVTGDAAGFHILGSTMSLNAAAPLTSAGFSFFTANGTSGSGASYQFNGAETGRLIVTSGVFTIESNSSSALQFATQAGSVIGAQIYNSGGFWIGSVPGGDPGVNNLTTQGTVNAVGGFKANGTAGVSTTCTVTAGNTLVFTNGILTTKGTNCT